MKRRVVVQSETIRLLKALIREELNQAKPFGGSVADVVRPSPLGGVAKEDAKTWADWLLGLSPGELAKMIGDGSISVAAGQLPEELKAEARRRR